MNIEQLKPFCGDADTKYEQAERSHRCQECSGEEGAPFLFRFHGGVGVVMPMRG